MLDVFVEVVGEFVEGEDGFLDGEVGALLVVLLEGGKLFEDLEEAGHDEFVFVEELGDDVFGEFADGFGTCFSYCELYIICLIKNINLHSNLITSKQ